MRNLDLAPLWRSTVGFDRFFDLVEDSLRWSGEENYPPYNIAKTGEDQYAITLALAGFAPEDVSITAEQNTLTVEGHKTEKDDQQMLYQGIAARHFRRTFSLADYMQVKGASFENGLLKVRAGARDSRGDEATADPDCRQHRRVMPPQRDAHRARLQPGYRGSMAWRAL